MASGFDVFCVGKTTIDQFLILNEENLKYHLDPKTGFLSFKHGEKISVEEFAFCLGGNATNVTVGLSRMGLKTSICSEIGDDEFGHKITNALAKENIDRTHMIITRGAPSSFSVIINFKGERTIFNRQIKRENRFNLDEFGAKFIFLTSLDKEWPHVYRKVLSLLLEKGCRLAFNPGTLQLRDGHELMSQILKHTDILFVNKEEAEELVWGHEKRIRDNRIEYIRELLVKLQKMGARTAVVTNGRHGSHAVDEYGNYYHEGLFPGKIVERTGAGDAYTSGFLAATIYGLSVKEAMKWGATNAASVVEHIGATQGLLVKHEIEAKLKNLKY